MTEETEVCTKISEKVKMAGFLEKKGSMLWKRYWFVLEDSLLLYYKSQLEYINLSPCRGSVNMGLVSSVQPRRNSKEPVIHLVSRTHTLVLKAKDRETQEKWMQSLVDSVGKSGGMTTLSTFRFSLDDLPGQLESMTLPRRLHSGSLDAVWKPSANIPKTKMIDKVLAYEEEEPDENQNTSLTREQKSATLDNRRGDFTLLKLRNAIGRRKASVPVGPPEITKVAKQRRESFLRKIFKKTPIKVEEQEVGVQVQESDGEDPLYDKIDNNAAKQQGPGFGCKNMLPEGTLAELKDKLKSRESTDDEEKEEPPPTKTQPPALPPRGSLTALNTLVGESTTVAIIHQIEENAQKEDNVDDSEESELSGHYQKIHRSGPKSLDAESTDESDFGYQKVKKAEVVAGALVIPEEKVEAQYTVVNKSKKKKKVAPVAPTSLDEKTVEALDIKEDEKREEREDIPEEANEPATKDESKEIELKIVENSQVSEKGENEKKCNEDEKSQEELEINGEATSKEEQTESTEEITSARNQQQSCEESSKEETTGEDGSDNSKPVTMDDEKQLHREVEDQRNEEEPDEEVREPENETHTIDNDESTTKGEDNDKNTIKEEVKSIENTTKEVYNGENTNEEVKNAENISEEVKNDEETKKNKKQNGKNMEDNTNDEDMEMVTRFNESPEETTENEVIEDETEDSKEKSSEEELEIEVVAPNIQTCNHGTELKIVEVIKKTHRSAAAENPPKEDHVQIGLTDLNMLLLRLQEITTAPLSDRPEPLSWTEGDPIASLSVKKRRLSDPDYDIPRPHAPMVHTEPVDEDRLKATGFFNKAENDSLPSSNNSLEPDSLESKKEEGKEEEKLEA